MHVAVLTLVLAATQAPPSKHNFLLLPDLLKYMEKSPIRYDMKTTDALTGLDIADFGAVLYPRSVEPLEQPQVEVRDGRRVVVPAPCEAIDPMRKTAENLFESRNYAAAGAIYQEMMQKAPRCWVGFAYYGDSLFFAKQYAEALPWYEKAIALDPDEGALYTFRSNAFFRLGNNGKAIDDLRWSLALRPHHPSPVKVLSGLASRGQLEFHDVVFKPRAIARKEGDGYAIYFDREKPYWMAYGACKALWLSDPAHRKEITGSEKHVFSSTEELECVAALVAAYDTSRTKDHLPADPQLEFLEHVIQTGDISGWIAYELGARVNPQLVLTLPEEGRRHVYDFVKHDVVVEPH